MLLIITPLRGWRREIVVFRLKDATPEQMFDAFKIVNDAFTTSGDRDKVNISLVPISLDQLEEWIDNNVEPTWWEYLTHRIRYSIYHMGRAEA
jgi:hypothetical protein